ncbi:sulfotransferase family protein, partial [Fulvivirga kasyanovii]|nr:sulfotransferase family protein [Fulvivirga kasyanovii]
MTSSKNAIRTIDDFNKWIPVAFDAEKEEVQWIYAGDKDFMEPFFEDDIRLIRYESPKTKNTSLHEFNELGTSKPTDTIKPALFIFHISRCGSTLITQMLAQSAKNIVYSEPPLTDEILSSDLSHDVKIETLRAAITLMGQKRKAPHQYLFIKWDSWHLAYYELIRQAFPGVPAIFLYREPVEVLQSHQRVRGMHMVPGLLKKDVFQLKGIPAHDLDLYAANVL